MMHGHSEDINLSQVSIYGLHYNRPSSDADDLNLYVYFEVDGETASTSTIKGLPGSSVEWPSDNIHFKRKHSTSHPLQVKLYHKRTMMPDTIICEGSLPWEALLSQRGCEVPVSSKQGHSGTVRFTVGNTQSPGNQAGLIPGTTTNTAGSHGNQYSSGQGNQYGSGQDSQYAGYPNVSPAPDSYHGGQRQQQGAGTHFPPAPAYAGSQTSSQPYQSQLPHQGGGSQPPAYAGQSSGQTGYPGQGGTGGFPQAGQVTGSSTGYGTGGGPGPVTGQTNPTGVKQAGYADKAKGFLHKNLDSLDKRMEQWNQPRGAQGGSYSSGQMGPTDPMVNAVGAAPAGNVSAASQQGTRTGQPRFTDIAKDTGSWGFNKLHQGVKLTKGLASDKPGTKPATGSSAGAGAGTTGQGYRP